MKRTNNKGFSLVELIIVIAIMAILIGILAPQYMQYVDKSRVSSDKDLMDSIYNACTIAYSDPDVNITAVAAQIPQTGTANVTSLISGAAFPATSNTWGETVLATLGMDWTTATGKIKSNAMTQATINVFVDANGNFSVQATGATDPADPNGGDYTVPQQY